MGVPADVSTDPRPRLESNQGRAVRLEASRPEPPLGCPFQHGLVPLGRLAEVVGVNPHSDLGVRVASELRRRDRVEAEADDQMRRVRLSKGMGREGPGSVAPFGADHARGVGWYRGRVAGRTPGSLPSTWPASNARPVEAVALDALSALSGQAEGRTSCDPVARSGPRSGFLTRHGPTTPNAFGAIPLNDAVFVGVVGRRQVA